MITALIFDLSHVVLFPKDKTYTGRLSTLHDELLQTPGYKFFDHFELNEPLMQLLEKIHSQYRIYLYTTGHMHDVPEMQPIIARVFRKVYTVEKMPIEKSDAESFRYIARALQRPPEEIMYIDDTLEHLEQAGKAGLVALKFQNNEQLFHDLGAKGIS